MKDIHGNDLEYAKLSPPQDIEKLKKFEEDIRKNTGKNKILILA